MSDPKKGNKYPLSKCAVYGKTFFFVSLDSNAQNICLFHLFCRSLRARASLREKEFSNKPIVCTTTDNCESTEFTACFVCQYLYIQYFENMSNRVLKLTIVKCIELLRWAVSLSGNFIVVFDDLFISDRCQCTYVKWMSFYQMQMDIKYYWT